LTYCPRAKPSPDGPFRLRTSPIGSTSRRGRPCSARAWPPDRRRGLSRTTARRSGASPGSYAAGSQDRWRAGASS
jgi:hypothetical protein